MLEKLQQHLLPLHLTLFCCKLLWASASWLLSLSVKGSSRIDYGKGRPELYQSIGIVFSRSLAGLRTCKVVAHRTHPWLIVSSREETFRCIGFNLERMSSGQGDLALHAPVLDNSTPEGPTNRAKLLRAWVELSAWQAGFTKRHRSSPFDLSDLVLGDNFSPPLY